MIGAAALKRVLSGAAPEEPIPPSVRAYAFDESGWLVELEGDCDVAAAEDLRRAIASGLAAGHRHLVVDLTGATLVDCSTLSALFTGAAGIAGDPDADLALVASPGEVPRMLELVGLDSVAEVFGDRAEATASTTRGPAARRDGWRRIARAS